MAVITPCFLCGRFTGMPDLCIPCQGSEAFNARAQIHVGDCVEVARVFDSESVDAVVTDPPYGLKFMGKKWDHDTGPDGWCDETFRVLKPGGYLLAFGGTRTYHRLTCAIEDAGFEIRNSLHWIYGTGFPKSHNVSKAIDKAAGVEPRVIGTMRTKDIKRSVKADIAAGCHHRQGKFAPGSPSRAIDVPITAPASGDARRWAGWGTALKPAHEPIVVARKPLAGTVAANMLRYGTGGLNIDACRVGTVGGSRKGTSPNGPSRGVYGDGLNGNCEIVSLKKGRWPPNLLLSHSAACGDECAVDCPVAEMDRQSGTHTSGSRQALITNGLGGRSRFNTMPNAKMPPLVGDTGGASRFFPCFRYEAKPSRSERNAGLEGMPELLPTPGSSRSHINAVGVGRGSLSLPRANHHPTVKPIALMAWLCQLVTQPSGVVLDPFLGSGTTGIAALRGGFRFVGVEREPDYIEIAQRRMAHWVSK